MAVSIFGAVIYTGTTTWPMAVSISGAVMYTVTTTWPMAVSIFGAVIYTGTTTWPMVVSISGAVSHTGKNHLAKVGYHWQTSVSNSRVLGVKRTTRIEWRIDMGKEMGTGYW